MTPVVVMALFFFTTATYYESPAPAPAKEFTLKGFEKTFSCVCFCRVKAAKISLASLHFGIRGSWGASNLVLPAKETELLFSLIQLGLLDLGAVCKEYGEYLVGNPSFYSAGNPTPYFRVSLQNLVAGSATKTESFFTSRGFHPVRVLFFC